MDDLYAFLGICAVVFIGRYVLKGIWGAFTSSDYRRDR